MAGFRVSRNALYTGQPFREQRPVTVHLQIKIMSACLANLNYVTCNVAVRIAIDYQEFIK